MGKRTLESHLMNNYKRHCNGPNYLPRVWCHENVIYNYDPTDSVLASLMFPSARQTCNFACYAF